MNYIPVNKKKFQNMRQWPKIFLRQLSSRLLIIFK